MLRSPKVGLVAIPGRLTMRLEHQTVAVLGALLCFPFVLDAQQLKVVEEDGHLSPLMVKIVFLNDASRTVMLRGIGMEAGNSFTTHSISVKTDGGASERRIWLDSIGSIQGTGAMRTRGSEFTVILKDGKKVAAQFTGTGCRGDISPDVPTHDCRVLCTQNEDGGDQKIDLQKVKSVEFMAAARKDKAGNAMFDTWRYSPYTGEKLPQ
jgi:hypothetical protein